MSALLLIDAGNTRLKWMKVTPRGAMKEGGYILTERCSARWVASWARQHAGARVVGASVVPAVSTILRQALPGITLVRGDLRGLPLAFKYPKPAEIGADRIAAALAAAPSAPAIIINCGTATAFSVLDRRSRFCGGAIMPGLATQLRALVLGTAQLPLARIASPGKALGKSTAGAIKAGVLLGWQAGVIEIVKRLSRETGGDARVIVTGGEAAHLRGVRGLGRAEFRPLLVFEGLRIMADSLCKR